jgi:hypothetical protein
MKVIYAILRAFEGLKITTKLALGLGSMAFIILLIGVQSIYSTRVQAAEIQRMYAYELQGVSHIKDASIHLMEIGRSLRQMVLAPNRESQTVLANRLVLQGLNCNKPWTKANVCLSARSGAECSQI